MLKPAHNICRFFGKSKNCVKISCEGTTNGAFPPSIVSKKSESDSLIFVCTGMACLPPVTTPADALRLL